MSFTEVWLITQLGYSGMLHCVSERAVGLFNAIKHRAVTPYPADRRCLLTFGTNEFVYTRAYTYSKSYPFTSMQTTNNVNSLEHAEPLSCALPLGL